MQGIKPKNKKKGTTMSKENPCSVIKTYSDDFQDNPKNGKRKITQVPIKQFKHCSKSAFHLFFNKMISCTMIGASAIK